MTSGLDRFGASLVAASHALSERAAEVDDGSGAPSARAAHEPARSASPLRRRSRRRGLRLLAGSAAVVALAAAGVHLLGPRGNPRYVTQFECGESGHGEIHGLTGPEPVADCAALWPSLYHRRPPALLAWIYETGGAVVVRPADQPPRGRGWQMLPRGWTADTATIELNDQLEDITTGLPSRECWTAASAEGLVRALLRSDGLGGWRLRVSTQSPAADATAGCLSVTQAIGGSDQPADTVLLVERAAEESPSPRYPSPLGARRRAVEERVNSGLLANGGCATPQRALTLWRREARAVGIPASDYVLNTSGAAFASSPCARVFVEEPGGGGPADVYAAKLP